MYTKEKAINFVTLCSVCCAIQIIYQLPIDLVESRPEIAPQGDATSEQERHPSQL